MLTGVQAALTRRGPRVVVAHGLLLSVLTWALNEPPDEAPPLFFPEAACLDLLVVSDARLRRLTARLIAALDEARAGVEPTEGGGVESGRGGLPILANFDPLRTP